MEQFKVDNVIEEQFGILKGVDLIDIDISTLNRKLEAYPLWDIYKLYSYYTQIIKSSLYDISNIEEETENNFMKETKEKLVDRLEYFESRATYLKENIYKEDNGAIKHKILSM